MSNGFLIIRIKHTLNLCCFFLKIPFRLNTFVLKTVLNLWFSKFNDGVTRLRKLNVYLRERKREREGGEGRETEGGGGRERQTERHKKKGHIVHVC